YHLIVPRIGRQRPAVTEYHRRALAPILIVNLRSILGDQGRHVQAPLGWIENLNDLQTPRVSIGDSHTNTLGNNAAAWAIPPSARNTLSSPPLMGSFIHRIKIVPPPVRRVVTMYPEFGDIVKALNIVGPVEIELQRAFAEVDEAPWYSEFQRIAIDRKA